MIHLGTAGAWRGEPCGQSWYSWNSNGISTAPPERVCLDKLVNGVVTGDYLEALAEKARLDEVDGRVWLLFNEPDIHGESEYMGDPLTAARWYHKAYWALKDARPDVIVGGPNHYMTGHDLWPTPEDPMPTDPYGVWVREFIQHLHRRNLNTGRHAKLEIIAMHDYWGRYHDRALEVVDWKRLEDHIAWWRIKAANNTCIEADAPVWITETGILWIMPEQDDTSEFMAALLAWLGEKAEALGIERCYWFVSYDSGWWANVSNTCLYNPEGELTAIGEQWKAASE